MQAMLREMLSMAWKGASTDVDNWMYEIWTITRGL